MARWCETFEIRFSGLSYIFCVLQTHHPLPPACYKDTFKEEMVSLAATAINQRRQVAWRDHLEALDSSVYIQRSYR